MQSEVAFTNRLILYYAQRAKPFNNAREMNRDTKTEKINHRHRSMTHHRALTEKKLGISETSIHPNRNRDIQRKIGICINYTAQLR